MFTPASSPPGGRNSHRHRAFTTCRHTRHDVTPPGRLTTGVSPAPGAPVFTPASSPPGGRNSHRYRALQRAVTRDGVTPRGRLTTGVSPAPRAMPRERRSSDRHRPPQGDETPTAIAPCGLPSHAMTLRHTADSPREFRPLRGRCRRSAGLQTGIVPPGGRNSHRHRALRRTVARDDVPPRGRLTTGVSPAARAMPL